MVVILPGLLRVAVAMSFNDAGRTVRRHLLQVEARGETLRDRFRVSVLDDGPGMPAGEREALLGPRMRGTEARTRRPDGQGLGLAIVTEAAEVLGLALAFTHPDTGGLRVELTGPILADASA